MQKHNVPMEALAKIWNLVNPQSSSQFSKQQFFMTLQLLSKVQQGVPVPQVLPQELVLSSQVLQ